MFDGPGILVKAGCYLEPGQSIMVFQTVERHPIAYAMGDKLTNATVDPSVEGIEAGEFFWAVWS